MTRLWSISIALTLDGLLALFVGLCGNAANAGGAGVGVESDTYNIRCMVEICRSKTEWRCIIDLANAVRMHCMYWHCHGTTFKSFGLHSRIKSLWINSDVSMIHSAGLCRNSSWPFVYWPPWPSDCSSISLVGAFVYHGGTASFITISSGVVTGNPNPPS